MCLLRRKYSSGGSRTSIISEQQEASFQSSKPAHKPYVPPQEPEATPPEPEPTYQAAESIQEPYDTPHEPEETQPAREEVEEALYEAEPAYAPEQQYEAEATYAEAGEQPQTNYDEIYDQADDHQQGNW